MKQTVIILTVILICSCSKDVSVKFDRRTFVEQRQLWQASNTKDYEYHLFASGFIMYYGKITVENGSFKSDEILHEHSSSITTYLKYSTIDKIYQTIEEIYNFYNGAIRSDYNTYCNEIVVEYDKTNHIPVKINYIHHFSPDIAVDGTFDYEITNFKKQW